MTDASPATEIRTGSMRPMGLAAGAVFGILVLQMTLAAVPIRPDLRPVEYALFAIGALAGVAALVAGVVQTMRQTVPQVLPTVLITLVTLTVNCGGAGLAALIVTPLGFLDSEEFSQVEEWPALAGLESDRTTFRYEYWSWDRGLVRAWYRQVHLGVFLGPSVQDPSVVPAEGGF